MSDAHANTKSAIEFSNYDYANQACYSVLRTDRRFSQQRNNPMLSSHQKNTSHRSTGSPCFVPKREAMP
jgi:hypothetical protein